MLRKTALLVWRALWRSSFGTVLYPATWNHDLNFVGSGRAVFDSMRFEHARKEKLATTGLSEALIDTPIASFLFEVGFEVEGDVSC